MQVLHTWLVGPLRWPHARLVRVEAALAQIAARTRRHHVLPRSVAAARARHQVIEGEVVARAAILAGEAVAQEHVKPRKRRMARRPHKQIEGDDAWQAYLESSRAATP